MLLDIIKQFNWLDIVIILIFVRICSVSLKTGFLVEIFKLLGTLFAVYCSLHYYIAVSDYIKGGWGKENVPLEFLDFLIATFLAVLVYLVFFGMRLSFERFIKMETTPNLSKAGGLILGVGRAFLVSSLVTFLLAISSVVYLNKSALSSFSGRRMLKMAPDTYTWMWNNFASKFMADEKFNTVVLRVQKDLKK